MPTIIYVILIIFSVVILILSSKIQFVFLYKKNLRVLMQIGPFKFDLTKQKKKKKTTNRGKAKENFKKADTPPLFVRKFILAIWRLEKRVHFKIVRLRLNVGGKNAVETAFLYTLYTRGISYLIEALDYHFSLDSVPIGSSIYARTDFLSQKTSLDLKVILHFSVYSLFSMGKYLFKEINSKKYLEKSYGKHKAK